MAIRYKIVNTEVLDQFHKDGNIGDVIDGLFPAKHLAEKVGFKKFDCKVIYSGTKDVTSALVASKDENSEMVIITKLII